MKCRTGISFHKHELIVGHLELEEVRVMLGGEKKTILRMYNMIDLATLTAVLYMRLFIVFQMCK